MIDKLKQAIIDNYREYDIPYKLTIGEYHTLIRNMEKKKKLGKGGVNNLYICFLGDVEENAFLVDVKKNIYTKLPREEFTNYYVRLSSKLVNEYYRFYNLRKRMIKERNEIEEVL